MFFFYLKTAKFQVSPNFSFFAFLFVATVRIYKV